MDSALVTLGAGGTPEILAMELSRKGDSSGHGRPQSHLLKIREGHVPKNVKDSFLRAFGAY